MIITGYSSPISASNYAYDQARKSLLERNLRNIGKALDRGDMAGAQRAYQTLTTNNPQYKPGPASDLEAPVYTNLRAFDKALTDRKLEDAKKAFGNVTKDLAKQGIQASDGNLAAARATAALQSVQQSSIFQATLNPLSVQGGLLPNFQLYDARGNTRIDGSAGGILDAFA